MSYQTPQIDWDVENKQLKEMNYMTLEKFEKLVDLLDVSNSQEHNIERMLDQVKEEFSRKPDSQIPLFSVPNKIGSSVYVTVRSKTINNSMLCLTDRWYRVELGLRGKVEIDLHKWEETKSEFYRMMF